MHYRHRFLKDLATALDDVENDSTIKAVVIQGEGKFFSAGADIKEFTSLQSADDYEDLASQGQNLFRRIEKFKVPVIASIHGAALGGGLRLAMILSWFDCYQKCQTRFARTDTRHYPRLCRDTTFATACGDGKSL